MPGDFLTKSEHFECNGGQSVLPLSLWDKNFHTEAYWWGCFPCPLCREMGFILCAYVCPGDEEDVLKQTLRGYLTCIFVP